MKVFDSQGREKLAGAGGAADGLNRISAGTQIAATLATVVFSNSNNVTFGMTNSSQVTASVTVASTQGSFNLSAGTTSNLASAFTFSNSNGVSFGLNAGTITASHNAITTGRASTDAVGLATAQTNVTWTVNSAGISLNAAGYAGTGTSATNASITLNSNGLAISVGAGGAGDTRMTAFATGNTVLSSTGTLPFSSYIFRGSNQVSIGVSNGSIVVDATTAAQTNQTGGIYVTAQSTGQSSSSTYDLRTLSMVGDGIVSIGWSVGTLRVSATQSNQAFSAAGGSSAFQTLGFSDNGFASWTNNGSVAITQLRGSYFATGNTTQSSSGTINANTLILRGSGAVSVGVSNGSLIFDAPSAAAGNVTFSAGTSSVGLASIVFSNSNSVSFGLNGSTITGSVPDMFGLRAGVSTDGNTAGSTGTVSTGNFVLVGSNGITLSQSTGAAGSAATVTIAGYAPLSSYDAYFAPGASTLTRDLLVNATSNVLEIFPFSINQPVSAGIMNMVFSASFTTVGTSSGRQTGGLAMAIYTRNASTLSSLTSGSFSWQVTGNNSSYTINQVTQTNYTGYGATGATNSAGVNITSGYTGGKIIGFPINSLLTPGVYWLGILGTGSTSSVNVGMSLTFQGAVINSQASALAPIGSFSTAYSTGQDPAGGRWQLGNGRWSSAGSGTMVPVSMNLASVSAGGNSVFPFIRFWST